MASHSYLGAVEAIRSRSFLTECKSYELIILPLPNIILYPGETIPLRIRNENYIRAIEKLMNKQESSFHGGLTSFHIGVLSQEKGIMIGTSAEIRYTSNLNPITVDEIILTAKGCNRFRVLETPHRDNGVYTANVMILEEKIPIFGSDAGSTGPFPAWVSNSFSKIYVVVNRQEFDILEEQGPIYVVFTTTMYLLMPFIINGVV